MLFEFALFLDFGEYNGVVTAIMGEEGDGIKVQLCVKFAEVVSSFTWFFLRLFECNCLIYSRLLFVRKKKEIAGGGSCS